MSRHRTSLPLVFVAAAWLSVAACSEPKRDPSQFPISKAELEGPAPGRPTADAAELTYRRYCVGCHGSDGRGNEGTTGANLTAPDGPLHTRSDAELIASVKHGKVGKLASMPAHQPILKDDQIAAVVAYVRKQFGSEVAPDAAPAGKPAPQVDPQ